MNDTRLCAAHRPASSTLEPHPGDCWPTQGAHLPDCGGDPCKGCLPRTAYADLVVCHRCRGQLAKQLLGAPGIPSLDQAPVASLDRLHRDLLQPTQAGPGGPRPEGAEQPSALPDGALDARTEIEVSLRAWNAVLDGKVGPFPWGQYQPGRWGIQPPFAGARWLDETRQPERTIATMAERLARHADRLLADDAYAARLIRDIAQVHRGARRAAYPTRPVGNVIGECPIKVGEDDETCGGQVRAVVDSGAQTGWATCNRCREEAVIGWWQDRMPAEQWLTMETLQFHLHLHCGRKIPTRTIWGWADTGTDDEPRPAELPSQVDEQTGRVLYLVARARELAALQRGRGRPRIAQPA